MTNEPQSSQADNAAMATTMDATERFRRGDDVQRLYGGCAQINGRRWRASLFGCWGWRATAR